MGSSPTQGNMYFFSSISMPGDISNSNKYKNVLKHMKKSIEDQISKKKYSGQKFFVRFLVQMKTTKSPFEIN